MRSLWLSLLFSIWVLASYDAHTQPHLDTARSYIGTREHGNNRGTLVDLWNRFVRAPYGSPWCASFVSWCLDVAHARSPRTRTAWSRGFVDESAIPAAMVLSGAVNIEPGDILIWRRSPSLGHIGFSSSHWKRAKGRSVEGNTSNGLSGSQWDGGGVYERSRLINLYDHFRITHIRKVKY